eukprot:TRINITY_DN10350_c2_g1_i1.p1 TRINITY_DN10350_c2_g1~~TRINITY_DN10350_c2_g1_i1.p1  ORF type:complete len:511 (-),score=114.93 TRINITY_DN10350_c2_g1_i1:201-1733(-)
MANEETPHRVGNYRLGLELGRGASCRVFACYRDGPPPPGWGTATSSRAKPGVAEQMTPPELAAKVVDLQRLRLSTSADKRIKQLKREAEILKRLPPHPNVVRFMDTLIENKWLFFVMERVDGGDLLKTLMECENERKRPRLTEAEALHVFRQLVEGLGFLHEKGIIHRDIKVENVLVAKNRKGPHGSILLDVKIADFGMSKVIGEGLSNARTTCGSPRYMAPEVLAGLTYDFRADLWSLGILLFVLLVGKFPFDIKEKVSQTGVDAAVNALGKEGVSAACREVLLGLLRQRPGDRMTIRDVRGHRWLGTGPVAMPKGKAKAKAKPAGKHSPVPKGRGRAAALPTSKTTGKRKATEALSSASLSANGTVRGKARNGNAAHGLFSAADHAAFEAATAGVEEAMLAMPKTPPRVSWTSSNATSPGQRHRRLSLKDYAEPAERSGKQARGKATAKRPAAAPQPKGKAKAKAKVKAAAQPKAAATRRPQKTEAAHPVAKKPAASARPKTRTKATK